MTFNDILYSEIVSEFEEAKTRKEKIEILRKYDSPRFREFLTCVFHPKVEFELDLPETYRPAPEPAGMNYTTLHHEIPKLYRFMKGHPKRPDGYKGRKQIQDVLVILEALHKDEAILFLGMVKKDLEVPYLTSKIVEEAYPGIILK